MSLRSYARLFGGANVSNEVILSKGRSRWHRHGVVVSPEVSGALLTENHESERSALELEPLELGSIGSGHS